MAAFREEESRKAEAKVTEEVEEKAREANAEEEAEKRWRGQQPAKTSAPRGGRSVFEITTTLCRCFIS
jgi:hypothetical protein